MFSSYIDRQKSGVGSSEKSQKVHSANWKEEVQLRKELECLNRQEQQRVSRISIDQRLAVNRFHKKLSKSVLIAKNHEQAITDLNENRIKMEKSPLQNEPSSCQHMRTIRCLNAFPKPPVPTFNKRRSKSCEPPKKLKNNSNDIAAVESNVDVTDEPEKDLMPRPMTALEKRNRLWERQLNTVSQRINRARSAPAKTSFYKVPEFSQSLETVMKPGTKSGRSPSKQRGMSYTMDMDVYRYLREKEITKQRETVKAFLRSTEPLELIPWTPYDVEYNDPNSDMRYVSSIGGNEEEKRTGQQADSRRASTTRRDSTYDKTDSRILRSYIVNSAPTKAWT